MKRVFNQIIVAFFLTPILFVIGFLYPNLVILDTAFGLLYYFLQEIGLWKPGPSWILEHRILSLMCFLVFPMLISFLYSTLIVLSVERVGKRNYNMAILYIVFLLAIFWGIQSSLDGRISYGYYHSSNY